MKKILAIVHDIHAEITDETIHETLKQYYGECHFEAIRFDHIHLNHGDQSALMWQTLKAEQEKHFEDVIAPTIEKNPNSQIVYFGLAPIPLCIHLGYLFGGISKVDVFQHHHDNKNWHWQGNEASNPIVENLPNEQFDGEGDIIIRFGTYTKINALDTQEILSRPIRAVNIFPEKTDRDLLGTIDDAKKYAKIFFDALKQLKENLPGANEIHLFAAVPCGLAFLMGTEIQPNVHLPIIVYHYTSELDPPYIEAFCIQERGGLNLVISESEKLAIDQLRDELEEHFNEDLRYFLEKSAENDEELWFKALFPKQVDNLFLTKLWSDLSKIDKTALNNASFTKTPHDEGQNKFFVAAKWFLPDAFLFGLKRKFDFGNLRIAMRLFWFHEGIHVASHGMHSDNSSGMGRYANVLEDADYQSDVYAMLHEYRFNEKRAHKNIPQFFVDLIQVATQTMLVFDEFSRSDTMETRRVKRYLIWFFQLAQIEDPACQTLEHVLDILANKPQLDIKLEIRLETKNRVYFDLKRYKKEDLGIAFLYKNRVKTFGYNDGQHSLNELVDGIRDRNIEPIKMVMRQLFSDLK
jgi:hypothetical protein